MKKKWWVKILTILLLGALIPVIFIAVISIGAFGILQSEKELQNYKNATASLILSSEGELIGKIFTENRTNIAFGQIPVHLINALIATEDARYYKHGGIDTRSLFRVFFKTILLNRNTGGGSTISQQLAKNMFGRKNTGLFAIFINKSKEAMLAQRLEKIFTKEDILALYLNTVPFGENVYGIDAASRRYFNKTTKDLRIEESAVLVGILKANNLYNPRLNPANARKRRNIVIGQMLKYKYLGKAEADSLVKLPLEINYANMEAKGPADYFLYQVKTEAGKILQEIDSTTGINWNIEEDGLIITTTLDLSLQKYANEALREHLSVMQKKLDNQYSGRSQKRWINQLVQHEIEKDKVSATADEIKYRQVVTWDSTYSDSISVRDSLIHNIKLLHAGLLALDPVTGAIYAWVGGIDFKSQPYDQIIARRQTGSTFKPILFAEAMEEGINPCFYLDNDSIVITGEEEWIPSNFDHSYGGKYTLTGSLVHSMNVPTFNLFLQVGFNRLDSLWKRLGFSFPLHNHPSLALGTAEANIGELAVAYSVFANGGLRITPYKIISIKGPDGTIIWENKNAVARVRVLSKKTSQLMNAILQKAVSQGTGSPLNDAYGLHLPLAGKTGTTQDYADAWFVAYNPAIVMVSRVGASLPSVHFSNGSSGSGSALALPLVALTLKELKTDPAISKKYIQFFPQLPPELQPEMECPDYKEESKLDEIIKIFKRDNIPFEKAIKKSERKKKPFFKRIFGG